MKKLVINASERKDLTSKKHKALRQQGLIPAVLYGGRGEDHFSLPLTVSAADLRPLNFEPSFIELHVDGKVFLSILQEKQIHPVNETLLHVDFFHINKGLPVVMDIPLVLKGRAEGEQVGGILMKKLRKLRIKALPQHMPAKVQLDVTTLGLGKTMKVRQVTTDNFTILNHPSIPAVAVEIPRALRSSQATTHAAQTT